MVENLPKILDELKFSLDEMKNQMDSAKTTIEMPFPRQEEFDKLKLRAIEIDAKLNSTSEEKSNPEEESERRLNNIFTVEPQTLCEKKFFALVKHAIDVNDHYTEHNQKLAVRDLFKAGFSQTEITETLFKNSPIVSDKEKLTNFINSFKPQVRSTGR